MIGKQLYIISADDDIDDQEFIQEALKQTGFAHALHTVKDGDQLLKFLNQLSDSKDPLPDVIFIDLNMPVKSGREVIRILKAENSLYKDIYLVVLTTSNSKQDLTYCLQNGATAFLVKPNSLPELTEIFNKTLKKISDLAFYKSNLS